MCNLRVLAAVLSAFGFFIPCAHFFVRVYGDIMLMVDNLPFTLTAISSFVRITIFWWKKEAIIPMIDMITEDWEKSEVKQERNIMIRRAHSARIITICSYCLTALCCFIAIVPGFRMLIRYTPNITDPGRLMPLPAHYIYDLSKRPQYELTYISQVIYIFFINTSNCGIDNFLALLIFHICGQLDILKNRLAHLDKYINSRDLLKSCIMKHIRLFRAIDIVEDAYNLTLLALYAYFCILLAFFGFRIIDLFDEGNDLSRTDMVFFVSTIFFLFGQLFLYCALGEFLVNQCDEIYYAVYSNKWYSVNQKLAQDLLLLLIRGSKPIYLTAGKMFPITLTMFCNIIKTSVGYVSVLHTMKIY
ncbi:PREDICTED: odorant receptor Or2-like [Vollenhovia emeryi]|uniref:odorant receptor Or2-like n=1 Tax=Vollenhovia emeryi TaxID=411798 RepID=UPI0005F58A0E|nr:PREDICTED: odorant receptor Or2-like [Vollenhovia emeryi]